MDDVSDTHLPVEGLGIGEIYQKSLKLSACRGQNPLAQSKKCYLILAKSHCIPDHNAVCVRPQLPIVVLYEGKVLIWFLFSKSRSNSCADETAVAL